MKIETGSFICLSEVLNLHVGLIGDINPLQIYKTGWFCGEAVDYRTDRFKFSQRKEESTHLFY